MPVLRAQFAVATSDPGERAEIAEVSVIADRLLDYMRSISDKLDAAHVHNASSKRIQDLVCPWLEGNFGAKPECSDGFEKTATIGNRADAQIPLPSNPTRRIIVEVERGGPITNNHDLKDLWKTHLSPMAGHLFLIVPNSIVDKYGVPRADRAFEQSKRRLGSFFGDDPRTWIDVLSLHIFGYGPLPPTKEERAALKKALAAKIRPLAP